MFERGVIIVILHLNSQGGKLISYDKMGSQQPLKAIAPKPGDSIFRTDISLNPRLQKSSTACLECRKRKRRVGLPTYPMETLSNGYIV
jgi:hypothetical protein